MPDDMCQTTEWTGWSECSTTCGKGYELRTRRFLNRMGRKKCPHVDTTERRSCAGTEATCPGGDRPEAETRVLANPDCAVTSWSDWSPCSVSCGKPEIYRLRPCTLPTAEILSGKNARAWVSMVLYLRNKIKLN